MADPIIEELWDVKDAIAREHGYDVDALVDALQEKSRARGASTIDLEHEAPAETEG